MIVITRLVETILTRTLVHFSRIYASTRNWDWDAKFRPWAISWTTRSEQGTTEWGEKGKRIQDREESWRNRAWLQEMHYQTIKNSSAMWNWMNVYFLLTARKLSETSASGHLLCPFFLWSIMRAAMILNHVSRID